jgi:hypothetical protein
MIYGTTESGGMENKGVLYRFNAVDNSLTSLFEFSSLAHGENPQGLTAGGDGWMYGLTHDGGQHNGGTLFRFNSSSLSFEKLIDFDSLATGSLPEGELLLASDGNFYGTILGWKLW